MRQPRTDEITSHRRSQCERKRDGRAQQLTGRYPAELSPLADELNALVAHNEEVVERQRTHVGNLAHALKTPLSVMVAEAAVSEGVASEGVASAEEEAVSGAEVSEEAASAAGVVASAVEAAL